MIDHAAKVRVIDAYVDGFARADPEAIVALFASDATVEDPIASPLKNGSAEILEFYKFSMQTGAKLVLDGPVRTGGAYAAFAFQVRLNLGGDNKVIHVIDTFKFNEAGKIIEMRAFWSPDNMTGF